MPSPTAPMQLARQTSSSSSSHYASPPLTPVEQYGLLKELIHEPLSSAQAATSSGKSHVLSPIRVEVITDAGLKVNGSPSYGQLTPAQSPVARPLASPAYNSHVELPPSRLPLQVEHHPRQYEEVEQWPPHPHRYTEEEHEYMLANMDHAQAEQDYNEFIDYGDDERQHGGGNMSAFTRSLSPESTGAFRDGRRARHQREETPDANRLPGAGEVADCDNCGLTQSPCWRRTKAGTLLCNACGLYQKNHGRPRPRHLAKRTAYKGGADIHGGAGPRPAGICCYNCETTFTPLWRKSADNKHPLCNACGLYEKTHGRPRPLRRGRGANNGSTSSNEHRHNPIKRSDSATPPPEMHDGMMFSHGDGAPSFPLPADFAHGGHHVGGNVGLWPIGMHPTSNGLVTVDERHYAAQHEPHREYTPFDDNLRLMHGHGREYDQAQYSPAQQAQPHTYIDFGASHPGSPAWSPQMANEQAVMYDRQQRQPARHVVGLAHMAPASPLGAAQPLSPAGLQGQWQEAQQYGIQTPHMTPHMLPGPAFAGQAAYAGATQQQGEQGGYYYVDHRQGPSEMRLPAAYL